MQRVDILILGGSILASHLADILSRTGIQVGLLTPGDFTGGVTGAAIGILDAGLDEWRAGSIWVADRRKSSIEALLKQSQLMGTSLPLSWLDSKDKGVLSAFNLAWMSVYGFFAKVPASKPLFLNSVSPLTRQPRHKPAFMLQPLLDGDRLSALLARRAQEHQALVCNYVHINNISLSEQEWLVSYQEPITTNTYQVTSKIILNCMSFDEWGLTKEANHLLDRSQWLYQQTTHLVVNSPNMETIGCAAFAKQGKRGTGFFIPVAPQYSWITGSERQISGLSFTDQETNIQDALLEYVGQAPDYLPRFSRKEVVCSLTETKPLVKKIGQQEKNAVLTSDGILIPQSHHSSTPFILHVQGGCYSSYLALMKDAVGLLLKQIKQKQHLANNELEQKLQQTMGSTTVPMPGCDFNSSAKDYLAWLIQRKPWLSFKQRDRLVQSYGTRVYHFMGDAAGYGDLGPSFAGGLTAYEINYLRQEEFAKSAEDILFRRSKIGQALPLEEQETAIHQINQWLQTH